MLAYPIVDTHVHLWDPKRLRYRWLDGIDKLNRRYLPTDYDAACGAVHVEKIVFVQCDCLPDQNLAEVAFVEELADKDARIAGIVAYAAVDRGKGVREDLEKLASHKRVKGVRRLLQGEADNAFCLRPEFLDGVAQLADFNLSFDICVTHLQLAACVKMVRSLPKVQFVLDHIGKPDIKSQLFEPWKADIAELAKLPNVSCKISGLVTEADLENWRGEDLQPYIDHVLNSFGPTRAMFGSDWPVVQLTSPFERWVKTLAAAVENRPANEQRRLFHDNALATYRLE